MIRNDFFTVYMGFSLLVFTGKKKKKILTGKNIKNHCWIFINKMSKETFSSLEKEMAKQYQK